MTENTELAWAAGFFDGEGCTSVASKDAPPTHIKPRLSVTQKDPTCLYRFNEAINGLARIYGPILHKGTTMYHLSIQNAKGVDTALTMLWPYLSVIKRRQAEATGFRFGTIRERKLGRPKKVN